MKVLNVIGHSCSGKTTFISKLVVKLKGLGRVATIKHLGHHNFSLEKGKDTTVFYESGISISAGIDSEKTVLSIRNNELSTILDILADQGIEFTVIEGFKTLGLPAIVIGDLESDKVLFRNPTLDDILNGLEKCPEYYTLNGIGEGLKMAGFNPDKYNLNYIPKPDLSPPGCMMAVSIPAILTEKQFALGFKTFKKIITAASLEISDEYPPVRISVGLRNGWIFSIDCEFLIAVIAEDFETASFVISAVYKRIKRLTAIHETISRETSDIVNP
jgi:molybdopterin-guanine dinucleotide biosynthesis protein MobB